jgi:hypothetical protein
LHFYQWIDKSIFMKPAEDSFDGLAQKMKVKVSPRGIHDYYTSTEKKKSQSTIEPKPRTESVPIATSEEIKKSETAPVQRTLGLPYRLSDTPPETSDSVKLIAAILVAVLVIGVAAAFVFGSTSHTSQSSQTVGSSSALDQYDPNWRAKPRETQIAEAAYVAQNQVDPPKEGGAVAAFFYGVFGIIICYKIFKWVTKMGGG